MLRRVLLLIFVALSSGSVQSQKLRTSAILPQAPSMLPSAPGSKFTRHHPAFSTLNSQQLDLNETPLPQENDSHPSSSLSQSLAVMQWASFLIILSMATVSLSPAPALVKELGADRATSLLSLLTAGTAATQIILSPLMGSVLDSVGRRPSMVIMTSAIAMATGITAMRPNVWTICLAKIVSSLAISQFFVSAQAILGDVTASDPGRMSQVMGFQYALVSSAFLVGGVAAGRLGDHGLSVPYGVATVFSACAAALVSWRLSETLNPANKVPFRFTWKRALESPLSCVQLLVRHGSKMRWLAVLLMLQSFPMNMGEFIQLFAAKEWNLAVKGFSNIIVLFGLSGIMANVASSFLVKRLGLRKFTVVATLSALCFPLGACISYKAAIIGCCAGFLGSSQMLATTAALTSEGTKSGVPQGVLAGERASLMALLKVIGPILYSSLYLKGQQSGMSHLPFVFNIGLSIVALVIGVQCLA